MTAIRAMNADEKKAILDGMFEKLRSEREWLEEAGFDFYSQFARKAGQKP